MNNNKNNPSGNPLHLTNASLMDGRIGVCKNLTCPSIAEFSLAIDHCPTCHKRLALTLSNSYLFEGLAYSTKTQALAAVTT